MELCYRKLTEKELPLFIEMRITQLVEEGAEATFDLRPNLLDYYSRHMADGSFVGFLCLDGEKIVGTGGLSIVEKPPYFGCPSGKIGLISSMFAAPDYRRKGIGSHILSLIAEEAKTKGAAVLQITASDMGVLLYTAFGFEKSDKFLQYRL